MKENSSIGFEAELFLIDSEGDIKPEADKILQLTSKLKHKPVKEYAKEVIEINAYPSELVEGAIIDYINTFYEIDEIIQKEDLYLLPMSVYPGQYTPVRRTDKYYQLQERVLGDDALEKAARCVGFHFHYPLPSTRERILTLYNFFVSMVPVFDLFMQSSPFYQLKQLFKDSRAFLYRDMKTSFMKGAYSEGNLFGGVPDYKKDFDSILREIRKRNITWFKQVLKYGFSKEEVKYTPDTNYYWGALRLNPRVATLELRSPDVNLPSNLLEGMNMFRKVSDEVVNNLKVHISSEDHFYKEDDILYIPSMENVRKATYEASLHGFDSEFAVKYAESFFDVFDLHSSVEGFSKKLREKHSFSDELINKAISLGWNKEGPLESSQAKEISLYVAELMLKEMDTVKARAVSLFSDMKPLNSAIGSELMSKILGYLGEEEPQQIDLSRSSTARLSNIKVIVLSPELLYDDFSIREIVKLRDSFEVVLLAYKGINSEKIKHLASKEGINLIEIPQDLKGKEYVKTLKGLIKLWSEASSIQLKEILYFGISSKESELMRYFGASATFNRNKEVKDFADVLVDHLSELPVFLNKDKP